MLFVFISIFSMYYQHCMPIHNHVVDTDGAELSKLLEMKGVKRSDHNSYLELYRETRTTDSGDAAMSSGQAFPSSIPSSPLHGSKQEQSRIAKLEKLIKNRL